MLSPKLKRINSSSRKKYATRAKIKKTERPERRKAPSKSEKNNMSLIRVSEKQILEFLLGKGISQEQINNLERNDVIVNGEARIFVRTDKDGRPCAAKVLPIPEELIKPFRAYIEGISIDQNLSHYWSGANTYRPFLNIL